MTESAPPPTHDLLVIWAWEFDADYVALLETACEARGLAVRVMGPDELKGLAAMLESGALRPRAVIDRVWDWGDEYAAHVPAVEKAVPLKLNPYPLVKRAWHKPTMHYELIARGLRAPLMLILPSALADPTLASFDTAELARLGPIYSVKGARSGGSGVLKGVSRWPEVLRLRKEWPEDETLLQTWVEPARMGARRAWFRIFYACGRSFPCWADDQTHLQAPVTAAEVARFGLDRLRAITQQIAGVCGLNVFSTEIALDEHGIWQVVDYVNEPCDFRLQSRVVNGVPDEVVAEITRSIASWLARRKR